LRLEHLRPLAPRTAPPPAPDGQGQPGQLADGAAGGGPGRDGPPVPWSVRAAAATGAGAVAALLAAAGLVVRRRRHAGR
jgi:MYXO-CTERM domain-containing protein